MTEIGLCFINSRPQGSFNSKQSIKTQGKKQCLDMTNTFVYLRYRRYTGFEKNLLMHYVRSV